jgi:two-component system, sensor histidine kinase and response regulator
MKSASNRRILVVDDNAAIHLDFKKVLGASTVDSGLGDMEADLFGGDVPGTPTAPTASAESYEISTAQQGQEALELVRSARAAGQPFALAFIDVRMPPGWDGVETLERLWQADPDLQAVICTAFSDYSWSETVARLGQTDRLLILKKPFDAIEVCQLASALVEKWNVTLRERQRLEEVRAAEREARAYAASLETVNRALETTLATTEESARCKSQFLLDLTHELLEPMATLLDAALNLEARDEVEQRWLSTLDDVCRNGSSLRRLLGDIVNLADIEAGHFKLAVGPCAPLELVRELLESTQPLAAKQGVTLTFNCTSPVPAQIESDTERLRCVLRVMIENALRRSTHGGEVQVLLGMERTASWQEPLLRCEVVDHGPAIVKEHAGRLFEPFQKDGDLSLELSLAKRLTHLLGGDLLAESHPEAGTTFLLTARTGALDGISLFEPGGGRK